jgi:uncharacterized membrane protein
MISGKMKWVLAVSIILNLFLVAAMIGGGIVRYQHGHHDRPPMPVSKAWHDVTKDLPPQSRERIVLVIKQAALSGEPDMARARDLRARAAKQASEGQFDAGQVTALSDEARGYENQARAKVENALIQGMEGLSPAERKLVAEHLLRASFKFRYFLMKPKPGEAGPDGKPAAAVESKP